MSRSNNTQLTNPANKFFEWSGSEGKLSYYDKEKKEKIDVKLPFTFLLLDSLSKITGFSNDSGSGIWSNEVRNTKTQSLSVRDKNGEFAKGLYADIKEKITSAGGKYSKSCYIAYKDDSGELVIGNLTLSGSSFGGGENKKEKYTIDAWIGFEKAHGKDFMKKAIVMKKDDRICVNGATKFYCPSFEVKDIAPETDAKSVELDKELQEYLEAYLKNTQSNVEQPKETRSDNEVAEPMVDANNDGNDQIPF